LGSARPTILGFGGDAHALARESVPTSAYSRLIRLMHYMLGVGVYGILAPGRVFRTRLSMVRPMSFCRPEAHS
jgi:hypothetical protein